MHIRTGDWPWTAVLQMTIRADTIALSLREYCTHIHHSPLSVFFLSSKLPESYCLLSLTLFLTCIHFKAGNQAWAQPSTAITLKLLGSSERRSTSPVSHEGIHGVKRLAREHACLTFPHRASQQSPQLRALAVTTSKQRRTPLSL